MEIPSTLCVPYYGGSMAEEETAIITACHNLLTNRQRENVIGEVLPVSWWARDVIIFHVNVFNIQTITKERDRNQKK